MPESTPTAVPPAAPLDLSACPYRGRGGRYVIDPATGKRVPLARPEAAAPDAAPAAPDAAPAAPDTPPAKSMKKGA